MSRGRLCIISHSAVAERQQLFYKELSSFFDVLVVCPKVWGSFVVKDYKADHFEFKVFDISGVGMGDVFFGGEVWEFVKGWKPDLLYVQEEWWTRLSQQCLECAESLSVPLVLFCWENIRKPNEIEQELLRRCGGVICGNSDAEKIVEPFNKNVLRCVQVGIDVDLFDFNDDYPREFGIAFCGRQVAEKGFDLLRRSKYFDLIYCVKGVNYLGMPNVLSKVKVLVVPSLDTNFFREQFPAIISEALLCGCLVVAFDSGNMKEHYGGCPAVVFAKQGDLKELDVCLNDFLLFQDNNLVRMGGRLWALENFGLEVVAEKQSLFLVGVLRNIIPPSKDGGF